MSDVVTESMINTLISFQSKNATDDIVWRGTVMGLITYPIARTYMDVVSYHGAVQQADPLIAAKEDLSYFLIKLDDVETTPLMVFASEWILESSLEAINQQVKVRLDVWDLATNSPHTDILTILRANGYKYVKIVSITS